MLLRTALALQHLARVRLAVRASNQIDPPVNRTYYQNRDIDFNDSTDLSCVQRSSSCIQQLDRPQLSATIIQLYLHDSTYTSCRHHSSSWRPNTTATDFAYTSVNLAINHHFCCICYLAFVPFLVFGCHYSHALNLNSFTGSTCSSAPQQAHLFLDLPR